MKKKQQLLNILIALQQVQYGLSHVLSGAILFSALLEVDEPVRAHP